ncbi:PHP domain-containing protein [Geomicrobium sp. JCM 19038]|uniref:PHP domain-containing protein n=1 Tax=Geomicrobium sp. JCM 19038 TaxID=1460635 RepID=UPI00045F48FE|nr:PHP domain-containing protein [Geomicrobium sp. JCM 19038]GAK09689.1 DNA polymerase III alpha subunit [Geomicrobium sp. JCM 19038]
MANFVHLQVKSEYSFLTSTCRIDALVARAKSLGYETLALTDRNVMYGVKKFIDACHNEGIKPIIGLELDVVSNELEGDVLVYAKNAKGYQTLLSLSTVATSNDERINVEQLAQIQTDDVIFIFPEQTHPIAKLINLEQYERASKELRQWQHVLPNDNYWCGLLPSTHTDFHEHNAWVTFLTEQNLTPIALANVTMLNQGDDWVKQCLHAIRDDVPVAEVNQFEWRAESHLLSEEEAMATWQNDFERRALHETLNVANLVDVSLESLTTTLPSVSDEEETTHLQQLVRKGAAVRFPELTTEVKERLAKEMQTIKNMGFSNYFLIVWDYMRYARKQGMLTGPGRGSAAGSLVAYCLFITDVNPLEYGLLFERFLNPERKSLPDIDLDFPDDRRDEMFHYLAKRYGSEHVAQIITFGTFGVRSSLRETAKVQGIRDALLQRVLKFIPSTAGELNTVIKKTSELQRLYKENDEVHEWFNRALAIEGLPRHTSLHAAGIVLSNGR